MTDGLYAGWQMRLPGGLVRTVCRKEYNKNEQKMVLDGMMDHGRGRIGVSRSSQQRAVERKSPK